MTDSTGSRPLDSGPSAEQLARIERIRLRRAAEATASAMPTRRHRRRRHVGQGSRIVAAGLGAGTMFGIVTILGLDNPVTNAGTTSPATTQLQQAPVAAPIQLVIHRAPTTTNAVASVDPPPIGADPTTENSVVPVQLTAHPVVKTITVASSSQAPTPKPSPAPAATTRASH
jgi:hypothetical protein